VSNQQLQSTIVDLRQQVGNLQEELKEMKKIVQSLQYKLNGEEMPQSNGISDSSP